MQANKANTGYYGVEGGLSPLFSCGSQPLAPSFLTGNGSHMVLWASVLLHVAALVLNITANSLFFTESTESTPEIWTGWAVTSIVMHSLAVFGTVTVTGFVKDVFAVPLINMIGMGLFLGSIIATTKMSYTHGLAQVATTGENITYNLSLLFQCFAFGSIIANAITAASRKNGM